MIKDSLKTVNMPRNFGKSFKVYVEKEIMPYQLYTQENIETVYVPIYGTVPSIDDAIVSQCMSNIDKWGCRGEGHKFKAFNISKHLSKYCEMDCHVLRLGYEPFRGVDA